MQKQPTIGQAVNMSEYFGLGSVGTIIAIHPANTIDVEMPSGKCFRLSGLPPFVNFAKL